MENQHITISPQLTVALFEIGKLCAGYIHLQKRSTEQLLQNRWNMLNWSQLVYELDAANVHWKQGVWEAGFRMYESEKRLTPHAKLPSMSAMITFILGDNAK